jgi:glycosyltransferase involved in cell wall biosynthesis
VRIVFAGRLEPRKGPDVLIRAAPRILEHHPQARFALVGADAGGASGGSFKAELERLATRLGVGQAIEMPGRADGPAAVAAELSRSTLCAVPSRWESMGYVAAEAAALGRPVVGSAIPALEEIVRDGESGRLVPPGDPGALADGILEVLALTPERRREMGEAGARLVATRCDPDRVADQTLAAYELAISQASARGAARRAGRGSRRSRAGR